MKTDVALNALCACLNKNFNRDTGAVDKQIAALKRDILLERAASCTVYCGWGASMEALFDERNWLLRGAYKVLDGRIVEDWKNL